MGQMLNNLGISTIPAINSFLPVDKVSKNYIRQTQGCVYSIVQPTPVKAPKLIHVSDSLRKEMGLDPEIVHSEQFLQLLSGNKASTEFQPYALCYGGHQFGHWAGQLGDGRAINLFDTKYNNQRWTWQLKGAGPTPYSRRADGRAVLRSSIREHLCSEAMHHLGIPTTRSLSLVTTGEQVLRDMMYDGNPEYEPGAIICRVAESFIRFGNFQVHAARKEHDILKQLADYIIDHHFPDIQFDGKDRYIAFFNAVADATLDIILHWQRVGFVHGVMNTDNMSILGLTIDYGPYGWLDNYDPHWTPNTSDRQTRRYRFGNQPKIAQWNLLQLANALYPLIGETEELERILHQFHDRYLERYDIMMMAKLGFEKKMDGDARIIKELERCLQLTETDMTLFFRLLGDLDLGADVENENFVAILRNSMYDESIPTKIQKQWLEWYELFKKRWKMEAVPHASRKEKAQSQNPKYVLRNYMAQLAIDKASDGDYSLIQQFYEMLKKPYDEQKQYEKWFAKRPEWARNKIGSSMLSCSS